MNTAFSFISSRDIELMAPLQDAVGGFNKKDRQHVGDWGILPLCCGWAASQNLNRVGSMIEAIQPQRDAVLAGLGHRPPMVVAMTFSSMLQKWVCSEIFLSDATARLRSMGRLTEEDVQKKVPYFSLAILLNCLDSPDNEDIRELQVWIDNHHSSWTELFFAVGILKPDALRLQRVASVLGSVQSEPVKEQFRALLQTYRAQPTSRS